MQTHFRVGEDVCPKYPGRAWIQVINAVLTFAFVALPATIIVSGMDSYLEWVRTFCLSLPHTTEKVRWEHNLLFCIGEKMFCVANLEPAESPGRIAFKCTPEKFAELVEIEGLVPAPYMAHNHWVSVRELSALRRAELEELIHHSYHLVLERLPKKTQAALADGKPLAKRIKPKPAGKRRR